jgi:phosphatidylglycerophosphatase C
MNLALFDFDGTITTRDVYPGFVTAVSPRWRVWLGWALLGVPYLGMKRGWVSPRFMRLSLAFIGFAGASEARLRAAGERYAHDTIARLLRPEAMRRIAWHQAQGDTVVVVSASMDFYLQPFCREHGLELVCNHPAAFRGRLTGGLARARLRRSGQGGAPCRPLRPVAVPDHLRLRRYRGRSRDAGPGAASLVPMGGTSVLSASLVPRRGLQGCRHRRMTGAA